MQSRFILFNVLFLLVFALIISGSIYISIWRSVTREFSSIRLQEDLQTMTRIREYQVARTHQALDIVPFVKEDARALSQHQRTKLGSILQHANRSLVPLLAAMLLFIIASALLLSHRFAGPAYRLKHSLGEVNRGNLAAAFSLRKKDELKDLAIEIEHTIEHFSGTITTIKELTAQLESAQTESERAGIIGELRAALERYRIRSEK